MNILPQRVWDVGTESVSLSLLRDNRTGFVPESLLRDSETRSVSLERQRDRCFYSKYR